MSPRPRTVQDEEVIAAIARAIGRVGPTRLTLADVAEEAGIARPTLLQRYGSKRGMLLAFAAAGEGEVKRTFDEAGARHHSPLAALQAALVELAAGVQTREALANHLAFLQMDLTDPDFRRYARAHAEQLGDAIMALLEDAIRRGELSRIAAARPLARAVQAIYNGAMITWAVDGTGSLEDAIGEALEALIGPRRP